MTPQTAELFFDGRRVPRIVSPTSDSAAFPEALSRGQAGSDADSPRRAALLQSLPSGPLRAPPPIGRRFDVAHGARRSRRGVLTTCDVGQAERSRRTRRSKAIRYTEDERGPAGPEPMGGSSAGPAKVSSCLGGPRHSSSVRRSPPRLCGGRTFPRIGGWHLFRADSRLVGGGGRNNLAGPDSVACTYSPNAAGQGAVGTGGCAGSGDRVSASVAGSPESAASASSAVLASSALASSSVR